MQVEVSKYTEGSKANELRPNGMPASLIKYDGKSLHLRIRLRNNQACIVLTNVHRKMKCTHLEQLSRLTGWSRNMVMIQVTLTSFHLWVGSYSG